MLMRGLGVCFVYTMPCTLCCKVLAYQMSIRYHLMLCTRRLTAAGQPHQDLWLSDGIYGSFNNMVFDGQKPQPILLRSPLKPPEPAGPPSPSPSDDSAAAAATTAPHQHQGGPTAAQKQADSATVGDAQAASEPPPATLSTTLWGCTCDSCDFLYKDIQLPPLHIGDWLLFAGSGAYTVSAACDFNGFAMAHPAKQFVFSARAVDGGDDDVTSTSAGGDEVADDRIDATAA